MDIMNIFTAMTWASIGSFYLDLLFTNDVLYYSSYIILLYYISLQLEKIDKKINER